MFLYSAPPFFLLPLGPHSTQLQLGRSLAFRAVLLVSNRERSSIAWGSVRLSALVLALSSKLLAECSSSNAGRCESVHGVDSAHCLAAPVATVSGIPNPPPPIVPGALREQPPRRLAIRAIVDMQFVLMRSGAMFNCRIILVYTLSKVGSSLPLPWGTQLPEKNYNKSPLFLNVHATVFKVESGW